MRSALAGVTVSLLLLLSSVAPTLGANSSERLKSGAPEWTNVTPAISPPAMAGAVMAYSSQDNRFVLFGGWNGTTLGETWVFDPVGLVWEKLATQGSPPARGDCAFAYDPRGDVFVLFGGWYDFPPEVYHRLGDTWQFYLSNATWVQISSPTSPSPRSDSAIAYDTLDRGLVLFGGFDGSNYLGETWRYDTQAGRWTNSSIPTEPPPRADGRLAYDSRHNRLVLFAGNDFSGPNFTFHHLDDTWVYEWPSNTWTRLSLDEHPPARDYAVFAFDDEAGEFLLHGGYGERVILGDLWSFNLAQNRWIDIPVVGGPEPRFAAVGGYDSRDHLFVIFSGLGNDGLLADTWFFRYAGAEGAVAPASPTGVDFLVTGVVGVAIVAGAFIMIRSKRRTRSESADSAGKATDTAIDPANMVRLHDHEKERGKDR